ncbi:hypothetical protein [Variovorax sp. GT1P44]|uniref:hypothetical protein n=1 Tax=Variovorax sp. GT1P44 TaxID=3443742 RepID=UPI003F45C45D
MIRILAAALFAILAGVLVVHATPRDVIARATPVMPSFDIAMPAALEPVDAALIAAADTSIALAK